MTDRARRLQEAIAVELVLARTPLTTEQLTEALVRGPGTVSARDGVLEVGASDVAAAVVAMLARGTIVQVPVATTGATAWALSDRPRSGEVPVPPPRRTR